MGAEMGGPTDLDLDPCAHCRIAPALILDAVLTLASRELQVLRYARRGITSRDMACRMQISQGAVRVYRWRARKKMAKSLRSAL